MEKGNFIQVTPFMHVPDIDTALRFFNDILGFKTLFREGTYAYVHRETAGFRMMQNHGDDGAPPAIGASAITSTCATWMRSTRN